MAASPWIARAQASLDRGSVDGAASSTIAPRTPRPPTGPSGGGGGARSRAKISAFCWDTSSNWDTFYKFYRNITAGAEPT
ncbi:hypothetical protein ZWY2020_050535 [Hordeum vulgare]|nr:hypothetical protein ZWY2020_050535 [Hordeum vulgare]